MANVKGVSKKRLALPGPGLAAPQQLTRPGVVQASKDSQQCCLTGTVGALDTGNRTGQYGKGQILEQQALVPFTLKIYRL